MVGATVNSMSLVLCAHGCRFFVKDVMVFVLDIVYHPQYLLCPNLCVDHEVRTRLLFMSIVLCAHGLRCFGIDFTAFI